MSLCSWKTLSNRVKFGALGLFRTAMRRAKARRGIMGVAMQCSSWNTYQMMRNILATAIQVFAMNMRGILWWHPSSTSDAWSLWIIVFITLSLGSLWRGGRRQKEAEHGMISFPLLEEKRTKCWVTEAWQRMARPCILVTLVSLLIMLWCYTWWRKLG